MTFTIASVNVNGIRAACTQRNENNPGMNVWLEETTADVPHRVLGVSSVR